MKNILYACCFQPTGPETAWQIKIKRRILVLHRESVHFILQAENLIIKQKLGGMYRYVLHAANPPAIGIWKSPCTIWQTKN